MITILWTEFGGDRWEQVSNGNQADILMETLHQNAEVKDEDIIIFFENSFGTSSYGDTYNIPVGTPVKIMSENICGVVLKRELEDSGIKYVVTVDGKDVEVYDRNIEVVMELTVDEIVRQLNEGLERTENELNQCKRWISEFHAATKISLTNINYLCWKDSLWIFSQIFGE